MSPLFWLDLAALGTSLLISTWLALMVLGFGPGRALNRCFALFAASQAAWAGFSLLLRLSLWLERGDPPLFGELAALSLSLMGIALLTFAVRYVGYQTRWADLAAVLGLVLTLLLSIPLFQHRMVFDPRLQPNGSTTLELSGWGLLAAAVLATLTVWSLILFWRERRRTGEPYLAFGVLILVIGFFLGGVLEVGFPVLSVTNTLGIAILGWGVVSRQLFNPLRESEERFRTIFDGLNDAVLMHDADTGAIVDVNAKMCEMFGYTREQALQINVGALSSGEAPYTQREAMAWMRKALDGEPQILEWHAKDSGGRLFWVEVNVRRAAIGRRDRLLVSVRDISKRKRVAEALRESEERYRAVVEGQTELICRFLPDGTLTFVNEAYCRYFGMRPEELMGESFLPLMTDVERSQFAKISATLDPEHPVLTVEHPSRLPDGQVRWLQWTIRATFDEDGHPAEIQAVGRDITEQRQAAEALKESEEKFRTLAEQSPNMIFINKGGRVVYTNRRAEELMGYGREEYYAADFQFLSLIAEEYRDVVRSSFARHSRGEEVPPYEYVLVTKDGARISAIIATRLITYEGERAILGVVTDITERKRVEEALRRRTAELEERNQELDSFAHTVAHDLQNPLSMIIGFAEMLEQDYATLPEKDFLRYLDAITRGASRMSGIINELLLMAGVRKAEVKAMPLDMARLVDGAEQRLADMIGRYQAEIIVPQTWPVAFGHGPWVEEIWVNYLSNALRYGGRPPRIELGADRVKGGDAGQPMIRFWIRDNGPGLAPEEQAQLFVPFTQLARDEVKGYGLGLSIVDRIVEKLGGRAGVESEVAKGSLFWFTLPAR